MDKKAALNCGFVSYPQLSALVITTISIDIQPVVREPQELNSLKHKLGLQI